MFVKVCLIKIGLGAVLLSILFPSRIIFYQDLQILEYDEERAISSTTAKTAKFQGVHIGGADIPMQYWPLIKIDKIIFDTSGELRTGQVVLIWYASDPTCLQHPPVRYEIPPIGGRVEVFGEVWGYTSARDGRYRTIYVCGGPYYMIAIGATPGACPDLAMQDIWVEPTSFVPGQVVTILFRAKNIGSADAGPFKITLLFDGREIGTARLNGLAVGKVIEGYKENFTWPSDTKCHEIKVFLDTNNEVQECDERNNVLAKTFCPSAPRRIPTNLTLELFPSEIPEGIPSGIIARGRLTRRDNGQAIPNKRIDVIFSDHVRSVWTDANGYYETRYEITLFAGSYEFTAVFAGDEQYEPSQAKAILKVLPKAKKPDLVVVDLWWEPEIVYEGDEVMFYYVEKNQGDAASSDFENCVFVGGQRIGISARGSLAPGQSRQRQTTTRWKATPGEHIVAAEVDCGKEIDEWDENNNRLEKRLVVYAGKPSAEIVEVTTDRKSYSKEGGSSVIVTVKVKNTGKGPISGLRINVDIADPTGKNVKEGVFEENITLALGEEKSITKEYWTIPKYWWTTPPGSLPAGDYTVTASLRGPKMSYNEKKTNFIIALWELFVEIDYFAGAEPSKQALEYVHTYFLKKDMYIHFIIDDVIYNAPNVLSDEDFWRIEQQYNDEGDDKSSTNFWGQRIGVMTSKYKWVLYGFRYSKEKGLGFCKLQDPCDETAGNYIFIALTAIEDAVREAHKLGFFWVSKLNAEISVLMHELGHAIGIIKLNKVGSICWEDYNYYPAFCVMQKLNDENTRMPIGYSSQSWELVDLMYYKIK